MSCQQAHNQRFEYDLGLRVTSKFVTCGVRSWVSYVLPTLPPPACKSDCSDSAQSRPCCLFCSSLARQCTDWAFIAAKFKLTVMHALGLTQNGSTLSTSASHHVFFHALGLQVLRSVPAIGARSMSATERGVSCCCHCLRADKLKQRARSSRRNTITTLLQK